MSIEIGNVINKKQNSNLTTHFQPQSGEAGENRLRDGRKMEEKNRRDIIENAESSRFRLGVETPFG